MRIAPLLLLTGCSGSGHLSLSRWTFSVTGQEVMVPAVLQVREREPYRLTTDVELPELLRGQPLTLTIRHLRAPAVLRADGVEAAAIDGRGLAPYHAWRIPASQARVHLELEVHATSFFAADFATAPELGIEISPGYRISRAASGSAALVTVVLATLMSLIYAVTWLLDRRHAAHGWFALQAILVTPAYAALFGGTPAGGIGVAIM